MHWFCLNDLNHCVDGIVQKYAVVRPLVPTIWPIQEDNDSIQKEVITLEEGRFSFEHNHARSLFGSQSCSSSILHVLAMNVHNIV
jgi:hypothetical protein